MVRNYERLSLDKVKMIEAGLKKRRWKKCAICHKDILSKTITLCEDCKRKEMYYKKKSTLK